MPPLFKTAWGYQGNAMDLPVADVAKAVPLYEQMMSFRLEETSDDPVRSATLRRDDVTIRLVENGGDATQDGCAFQVEGVDELCAEFKANGLMPDGKDGSISAEIKIERRSDGTSSRVFYIVAPDGLCYWLGERQGE